MYPPNMATDHIRYDILAQSALRGVVRTVLADAAKKGLPGDHHFKITFATTAPGVRLSDRMRAQYPGDMTIVLQHQFWDLAVSEQVFEVGLSFGGVPERVVVPFEAITAFYDPSVQFGFQFETVDGDADMGADDAEAAERPEPPAARPPALASKLNAEQDTAPEASKASGEPKPDLGGEVVRLDRFRKK
jgi:hypothetical protein